MRGSVTNYCVVNSSTQNENLKRHIGQHTHGRSQLWSVQLFLSLVANLKQHMRFHTGLWMQAMLEEDLLFRICWTWKKQQNTTPRQQCFGLNDLGWFQWKVSGEMKPIRCLLFPCGSHIPPSLQFTTLRFISSRQLCSGRNDLRRLILEKRASCQWFHYTLARLQRIWAACESWSYLHTCHSNSVGF